MGASRSKSVVSEALKQQQLLPSLKLFENEKNLTGSEYRFFNELLGPKAKPSDKMQPTHGISIKSIM